MIYSNFLYFHIMNSNISYQELYQISQECLYSTDYNIKTARQTFLADFTKNLSLEQFTSIIQKASQISLLTVCYYMKTKIDMVCEVNNLYLVMIKSLMSWFKSDGKIIRNNEIMQYHIYNIYCSLLNKLIKKIYNDQKHRIWLINEITSHPKLFLLLEWEFFIESIVQQQTQANFIKQKNRICSIQNQVLPKILTLVEQFLKVLTQKMKFNELTCLQQQLTLDQSSKNSSSELRLLNFSKQQMFISDKLFILFESVLNYPYAYYPYITYQNDDQQIDQIASIQYPDNIAVLLIQSSIYDSLFLFTQRLLLQKQNCTSAIINCIKILQKIVQCRLPAGKKPIIRQFRQKSLNGITGLIKNTKSIGLIGQQINFNLKMLYNFSLKKLRKVEPLFSEWFKLVFMQSNYLVKNIEYKVQNKTLKECFRLIKILIENATKDQIGQKKKTEAFKYYDLIISDILIQITKDVNLFKDESILKVKQLQYFSSNFFQNIKHLIMLNSSSGLMLVAKLFKMAFDDYRNTTNRKYFRLTNIFLLLSQLNQTEFVNNYIRRRLLSQKMLQIFGELMFNAVDFMNYYQIHKQVDCFQLEAAIFLFNESLIRECLQKIEVKIVSASPLKYKILALNNIFNCTKLIPKGQSIQPFLIFSFTEIMNQFKVNDIRRVNYGLKTLSYYVWKLKWSLEASIYVEMNLLKSILKSCHELVLLDFNDVKLIKCRNQLFEIIVSLSIKKMTQGFEAQLLNIINLAKKHQDFTNPSKLLSTLYNFRGIVSQLQQKQVYQYFLSNVESILNPINQHLFYQNINNYDTTIMKTLLKFYKQLFQNKYFRISFSRIIIRVLRWVNQMLFYWNNLLKLLILKDLDHDIISVSSQLFQIFGRLLKQNYFNIYEILEFKNNCLSQFMFNLLRLTVKILPQILSYPKYTETFIQTLILIVKYLSNLIFQLSNQQLIVLYSNILLILRTPCLHLLKQSNSQTFGQEGILLKILEIIDKMVIYIHDVYLTKARQSIYFKKATIFKNLNSSQKILLIVQLLKECWDGIRQITILKPVCSIIVNLVNIYQQHHQTINKNFYLRFSIKQSEILHYLLKKQSQDELDYTDLAAKICFMINKQREGSL